MSIAEEKERFRKAAKAACSSVENKKDASEQIAKKLFSLDCYKNCESVFAYFSCPQEVSTKQIIEKVLSDGKRLALPRCESESKMSFYYIENDSALEGGKFKGILEPKKTCEKAEPNAKALMLVPALAFGKSGSRLGRGKGFYDRFLPLFKGETIGLCFSKLLFDFLPEAEFDRRVSLVITEKEIIRTAFAVPQN